MKATTLPTLRERWNQIKSDLTKSIQAKADCATGIIYFEQAIKEYDKYINFTAQELALWMFVPCNSKGEPMDKIKLIGGMRKGIDDVFQKDYQKALDACIFEGWEIVSNNNPKHMVRYVREKESEFVVFGKICDDDWDCQGIEDIEDLIRQLKDRGTNLTLKPNHAKELNL